MGTVTEIKRAASRLSQHEKLRLAHWLRAQVDDRFSDDGLMAIAAEGALALEKREAAHAKYKTR